MTYNSRKSAVDFAQGLNELLIDNNDSQVVARKGLMATEAHTEAMQALFLGIKGGNADYLLELLTRAVEQHVAFRQLYKKDDPDYVDAEVKDSSDFVATVEHIYAEYDILLKSLQKSGTFHSMRSIGHMLWDVNLPGVLGYFAALLYNQNNVAAEASPVTTLMEIAVGNDLCKMLGYNIKYLSRNPQKTADDKITAWGHITCDGSVANLEGLWMARNLKYYALSVKLAMEAVSQLRQAREQFKISRLNGGEVLLSSLSTWELLNLRIDDVLAIPERMQKEFGIKTEDFGNYLNPFTIQSMGYFEMVKRSGVGSPVSMGPATMHYSWPKGAAILGIGAGNMLAVKVDKHTRMDLTDLKAKLLDCARKKIPVMNVVAVIGTTEESAVDDLEGILALRKELNRAGVEFAVHADAAWGGYFASMIVAEDPSDKTAYKQISDAEKDRLPMSAYVTTQYEMLQHTDSITIDPHKAGYIPYPAGGLCYRNSAMRNLVAFTAPVVYHGGVDPTVGVYGVEGSKPGAAASAVHFSHKIIKPDNSGYGKIMGHCMFNTKRLYAAFMTWNITAVSQANRFFIVPLVPVPAEQAGGSQREIQAQLEFIRDRIVNVSDEQMINDKEAFALFKELGQDQTIITYMFNYLTNNVANPDVTNLNKLNNGLFKAFSYSPNQPDINTTDLVITSSQFGVHPYGTEFMNNLRKRLMVTGDEKTTIDFNISTIMNPFLTKTNRGSFIPTIINTFTERIKTIITTIEKP